MRAKIVRRLALDDFRSWENCIADFIPGINILEGKNGLGKTNIVEAIEFLSIGTTHRVSSSLPLIRRGASKGSVRALIQTSSQYSEKSESVKSESADFYSAELESAESEEVNLQATIFSRGANRARINEEPSVYMKKIAGILKTVVFSPDDKLIVSADPAKRRDFIDSVCIQLFDGYFDCLQKFSYIAKQRAALLKSIQKNLSENPNSANDRLSELEVWTSHFIDRGIELTFFRKKAAELISPVFSRVYKVFSQENFGNEIEENTIENAKEQNAKIEYSPSFEEAIIFETEGKKRIKSEISSHFARIYAGEASRGRNLIGPHRDDLNIFLDGMTAREFASNGEKQTLALALKIALFELLKSKGEEPVLIFDDVFSQLDDLRRRNITDYALKCGQVFITAASKNDIPGEIINQNSQKVNIIEVSSLISGGKEKSENEKTEEERLAGMIKAERMQ